MTLVTLLIKVEICFFFLAAYGTLANGGQLNVKGCYLLPIQTLVKWVNHTIFVVDDLSYEVLIGIDFADAHSLSYDAWSHKVYFPD